MGQEEKKSKIKNKPLVAVLGVLVGVIVALAVVVVVVGINNGGGEKVSKDCYKLEDEYESRACLERVFNRGQEEEIDTEYDLAMNKALEDENYSLFADLLSDKADFLVGSEKCEEALKLSTDDRIEQLPKEKKAYYYSLAIGTMIDCEVETGRAELEEKLQALYNSEDMESPELDEEDIFEPEGGSDEE